MSALVLLITVLAAAPLLFVCSIQEATADSRTKTEMIASVRNRGLLLTTAGLTWGVLMTVFLISTALLLTTTACLAGLGGMRF
ncbi:hypothetical protein [Nonomuraea sp. NPDC050786]|uniref:hypothetical protein n=1 Tax=Nonomuraea sp. NPDC050786 TaxID=3154840 RepID=UPI0033D3598D